MQLNLTDEETRALLNLLIETIEADRYPLSRLTGRYPANRQFILPVTETCYPDPGSKPAIHIASLLLPVVSRATCATATPAKHQRALG
jgi:hypothetical protein